MTSGMSTWRDSSSGAGEIHIRWFLEDRSPLWCPGTHHVINSLTSPPGVCRLVGWEPAQACPLCRCIFSLQTRARISLAQLLPPPREGRVGKSARKVRRVCSLLIAGLSVRRPEQMLGSLLCQKKTSRRAHGPFDLTSEESPNGSPRNLCSSDMKDKAGRRI